MTWGMVAVAGATLVGGVIASDSANSASNKQGTATKEGIAANDRSLALTRADQAPFREGGTAAMTSLRNMLGIGVADGGDWKAQLKQGYADVFKANPQMNPAALAALNSQIDAVDNPTAEGPGGVSVFDFAKRMGVPSPGNVGDVLGLVGKSPAHAPTTYDNNGNVINDGGAPQGGEFGTSPLQRTFSVDDFWKDPVVQLGYQSGLDLGTKALKNAAPLTTGLDSGAAMKELTKFGEDYAGSKAADSQARFEGNKTNVFNRLAAMAGIGQTANSVTSSANMNAGNNNAALISAQGNASAASSIASGNAFAGGANNIASWWQQQNMLNQMKSGQTGNGYFGAGGAYSPSQATYNSSMYGV